MMVVLVLMVVSCGLAAAGTPEVRADRITHGDRPPGYIFADLPRLVATSDIVVLGTVQSAEKGERMVPGEVLYERDVVVRVSEQYHGPTLRSPTIVVHNGLYESGVSYEFAELGWLRTGDRAVYFLASEAADGQHHEIVALPGRLLISDDGTVSTDAEDPVARSLDGRSWSTVDRRIREAVRIAVEQGIEPLEPGPFGTE